MKKIILPILLFCAALSTNAQEYLRINSFWHGTYIPIEEIDSIICGIPTYSSMLPATMAKDPKISIFNKALEITHMGDSMTEMYDYTYQNNRGPVGTSFQQQRLYQLSQKRLGYTAFVETDSVYAAHGINSIEDLKAYAAHMYNEMYPEDANITDPTDRRNSLNRFVSYHLLPINGNLSNLTAARVVDPNTQVALINKYVPGVDISDWYETMMPYSIMKCTTPYSSPTTFINSCGEANPLRAETTLDIKGAEIINTNGNMYQGAAVNGCYHYINDIIAYDKQTQKVVLDEQIIINNATISPEFINNNIRNCTPYTSEAVAEGINRYGIHLPDGALKNIKIYNPSTQILYLHNTSWQDYQGDEMLTVGNFDFSIKLPSVPAGTYEINIGYNEYATHPLVAAYLDDVFCDTIDTSRSTTSGSQYWVSDEELGTPEAIAQNDSLLFAHGYRKGLPHFYAGFSGNSNVTMRDGYSTLRAIITTLTTDGKSDHYLRFKSLNDNPSMEFNIDYIELCPTHLLKEYK